MINLTKHKLLKFIILFIVHLLFAGLYILLIKVLFSPWLQTPFYNYILYFTTIFYCLCYFLLMWKDFYTYNYLEFFNLNTFLRIFKNLCLTAIAVLFPLCILYFLINDTSILPQKANELFFQASCQIVFIMVGFSLLYLIQLLWIHYMVSIGYLQKRILVIGKPDTNYLGGSLFPGSSKLKIYCGMLYQENSQWIYSKNDNERRIVSETEITDIVYSEHIGEILIFSNASLKETAIYKFIHFCQENRISCYLVPDLHNLPRIGIKPHKHTFIPLIGGYNGSQESLVLLSCKRIFDLVLALLILILSSPIFLVISLLIKMEDGGSIFYTSQRVGKYGKPFKFYKFRSMIPNAEQKKKELLAYNARPDGPLFKMNNDPRTTKIGKIIRKLYIDELPQLINILKGDLSFVGPRPHLLEEVAAYKQADKLRLECVPGMTCLPQIYDRNKIGFRQWVALDIFYRNHWSLILDFKILFKSIFIILGTLFYPFKK